MYIKDTLLLKESTLFLIGLMTFCGSLSEIFQFLIVNYTMRVIHPWVTQKTQKRTNPFMTNKPILISKHTWLPNK